MQYCAAKLVRDQVYSRVYPRPQEHVDVRCGQGRQAAAHGQGRDRERPRQVRDPVPHVDVLLKVQLVLFRSSKLCSLWNFDVLTVMCLLEKKACDVVFPLSYRTSSSLRHPAIIRT